LQQIHFYLCKEACCYEVLPWRWRHKLPEVAQPIAYAPIRTLYLTGDFTGWLACEKGYMKNTWRWKALGWNNDLEPGRSTGSSTWWILHLYCWALFWKGSIPGMTSTLIRKPILILSGTRKTP
jgi:hypothetical protein